MGRQLECTLISKDTGKEYFFDSMLIAEQFLNRAGGYIRCCQYKDLPIKHKATGEIFDVIFGKIKYTAYGNFANPTICWDCMNANGRCSWSQRLEPVKGWTAEPTIIRYAGKIDSSYAVKACPMFIKDKPHTNLNILED